MDHQFFIESINNNSGKHFLSLKALDNDSEFILTDYSTINGMKIKNQAEIQQLVNTLGEFTFQLEFWMDVNKFKEGQILILKENGLDDYWNDCLKSYEEFESWDVKPVKYIVRHICDSDYSKRLFPGSSLMRLLISKPENGKLNFTNTLRIDYNYDKLKQLIRFIYIENGEQKYYDECQASEGIDTFEVFMNWKKW